MVNYISGASFRRDSERLYSGRALWLHLMQEYDMYQHIQFIWSSLSVIYALRCMAQAVDIAARVKITYAPEGK